ncbi:hypothetical protein PybrP1_005275 [[Pythium] brassicae (nom. inval.)]|nr:hypothetical protein PybrP1_005275 [[Pythium] brassicae (nom. inval.)]
MTISKRVQKELYSAAPAGVLPPLAVVAAQQQAQAPKSAGRKRGARTHAAAAALPKNQSKRRASAIAHEPLVIPSTPQAAAACVGVSDSPRSGEESTASVGGAGVTFLEPVAVDVLMERADAFASSYEDAADWEQLKVSSLSEIFQDFEPMNFLPTMWSTSSLGDIEALGGAAAPALAFSGANELFSDSSAAAANPLSLWG